jgi:hypothetical protein
MGPTDGSAGGAFHTTRPHHPGNPGNPHVTEPIPSPPAPSPASEAPTEARHALIARLRAVRAETVRRTRTLSAEDQCVQSMPDASPAKWHLAHTTWFFEAMVLQPLAPGYRPFDLRSPRLFNSYYEALGPRHPRPQRGC